MLVIQEIDVTRKALTETGKWLLNLKGCHAQRRQKQWAIGDALVESVTKWSDWNPRGRRSTMWDKAVEATGHPEDSLFQYHRVASVFPPKTRIYNISFSCYHAVAGIADEKTRLQLLARAEKNTLSSEAIRQLVKKIQNKPIKSKTRKFSIVVSVDTYSKLQDAAIAQQTVVKKLAATLVQESVCKT